LPYQIVVCLHQPQYHLPYQTILSSLLTYRRELMFTSNHFYHERLFNGPNYKFLSTTLTLTNLSRGVARTRATWAQARASADPSIIHTGLDYLLNLIVTYRHSGAANRQYDSTKNHPILSAVHNSKTLNKFQQWHCWNIPRDFPSIMVYKYEAINRIKSR